MSNTSIIINSTDGYGKAAQKAMTCINPDATNEQLAELGQMITAAQNHTYGNTVRINKIDCDSEASKPAPTISASITQYSAATFIEDSKGNHNGDPTDITYNGDGDLVIDSKAIMNSGLRFTVLKNGTKYSIYPFYAGTINWPVTFKVGFTETETYKACSVDITITA